MVVAGSENAEHAAPYAEQYCATYGKKARYSGIEIRHHGLYTKIRDVKFDCVAQQAKSPTPPLPSM